MGGLSNRIPFYVMGRAAACGSGCNENATVLMSFAAAALVLQCACSVLQGGAAEILSQQ
jgi:hypothetical protein